jgi:translation initiation factor 2-alpha kinase 4
LSKARQRREEEEAERAEEIAMKAAQELDEQIQVDAMRQMLAKEQQYKARKRANSESTEVPPTLDFDTIKESFQEVEINGIRFDTVRLFHPRPGKFPFEFRTQVILIFDSTSRPGVYGRTSGGRHLSC